MIYNFRYFITRRRYKAIRQGAQAEMPTIPNPNPAGLPRANRHSILTTNNPKVSWLKRMCQEKDQPL